MDKKKQDVENEKKNYLFN